MAIPQTKPHRLPQHIYVQPNAYFITLCTRQRMHLFGEVLNGNVVLTRLGNLVEERWLSIPAFHPGTELHGHVVMPNHFHGIVSTFKASATCAPSKNSLPRIVSAFKSAVTRVGRQRGLSGQASPWQEDYWDHVIRSEAAMEKIQQYIMLNPQAWQLDEENAARQGVSDFYAWMRAGTKE